jgi:hypothetical protein
MDFPTLVFSFGQKLLYQKFCVEECIVIMKNPVIVVRSLVFFNECTIIHIPLLENAWLLFWRNMFIKDNCCYIKIAQQLGSHVLSSKFMVRDFSIGGFGFFFLRCTGGFPFCHCQ